MIIMKDQKTSVDKKWLSEDFDSHWHEIPTDNHYADIGKKVIQILAAAIMIVSALIMGAAQAEPDSLQNLRSPDLISYSLTHLQTITLYDVE